MVPLEFWGPEGRVECKVKFDVADAAYPVVSPGNMIESGFTFSFDDCKCYYVLRSLEKVESSCANVIGKQVSNGCAH